MCHESLSALLLSPRQSGNTFQFFETTGAGGLYSQIYCQLKVTRLQHTVHAGGRMKMKSVSSTRTATRRYLSDVCVCVKDDVPLCVNKFKQIHPLENAFAYQMFIALHTILIRRAGGKQVSRCHA